MKNKIKEIGEGYLNLVIKDDVVEQVSALRMKVCGECIHISTKHKTIRPDVHCTICKCPLAAKTRSMGSECPEGFWSIFYTEDNGKQAPK